MLTVEENEKLTRVGPDTPMGNLLRRYWHPVAASTELKDRPTKAVRLLCEDLVLYKDKSGTLGLVEERCAHRRVNLVWGIPENEGLRCPYHGWLYDETGQCIEQPGEPTGSTFKERIQLTSYPVQELGGLIFAYLGPLPAPLIPHYDLFVQDNSIRDIGGTMIPCNWLQCMENSLDPIHTEWLHGNFTNFVHAWKYNVPPTPRLRHAKIGFDRFEHGIIKRRVLEGQDEDRDNWRVGHPVLFPNILKTGGFQIRVPVDDTHTWHLLYNAYRPGIPVEPQVDIPYYDLPRLDDKGEPLVEMGALGQDFWAWYSQGDIAQRQLEKLGVSDVGIILYRDLLMEQMEKVERGEEPMEVYRDPAQNQLIVLNTERAREEDSRQIDRATLVKRADAMQTAPPRQVRYVQASYYPTAEQVRAARKEAAARAAAGGELLPDLIGPEPQVAPHAHREGVILPGGR